ncbi:MAG TPA: hypothetical protein DHW82_14310 [Spirochaetia bacterium]|nr:MAG: hypothetical protein A2Y41_12160 [Spirochaetes bacterium GWB1_36_13]HCL58164.1 hypothetical protein [Spirochaetia bacterium]
MRIQILYFSPYQSTEITAEKLSSAFQSFNHEVFLTNLTREKTLWKEKNYPDFFETKIKPHDLLCIGAPVYAHLMPDNMRELVENLPLPDSQKWGKQALPFITYGGVSSGIALYDAGKLLQKRERVNIYGLKVNSFHSLSRSFPVKLNERMPGAEIDALIMELAEKITRLCGEGKDHTEFLNYQINYTKPEKVVFPKVSFPAEKCIQCMRCIKKCPVQRLAMNKGAVLEDASTPCIFCGECYYACRFRAVSWDIERFEGFLKSVAVRNAPLSSETPLSGIY